MQRRKISDRTFRGILSEHSFCHILVPPRLCPTHERCYSSRLYYTNIRPSVLIIRERGTMRELELPGKGGNTSSFNSRSPFKGHDSSQQLGSPVRGFGSQATRFQSSTTEIPGPGYYHDEFFCYYSRPARDRIDFLSVSKILKIITATIP